MKKIQKKARQENKTKEGDSGDDKKPKLKEEDSSEFLFSLLSPVPIFPPFSLSFFSRMDKHNGSNRKIR